MKTSLKNFLQISSILLGFFFCIFIFWNRLLRKRELRELIHQIDSYFVTLYWLLFSLTLILVLYNIKIALGLKSNAKILHYFISKTWVINTLHLLEKYIINAPKNFYEWIHRYLYIKPLLDNICEILMGKGLYGNVMIKKIIVYVMYSIKIFVGLTFLYDILYFQKFYHFFKLLPLLLVPITFQCFIYILFHFADLRRKIINKWLIFEANEDNSGYIVSLQNDFASDPDFTEEVIMYHADKWEAYINTMMTIDSYYEIEKHTKPCLNILLYSLYNVGWAYLLYKIYS